MGRADRAPPSAVIDDRRHTLVRVGGRVGDGLLFDEDGYREIL